MDNRAIDVTSEGKNDLSLALQLVWRNCAGAAAVWYKIKDNTMFLYWADPKDKDAVQLAYPHNLEQAVNFIHGWLNAIGYPPQPDHDGDNGKGWRVFNEAWGHVCNSPYGFVGIQPVWAMYGK